MKPESLERDAADRIVATLREIPFLTRATIRRESARGDAGIDFVIKVSCSAIDRRLVCEVKSSGQPRLAREACLVLRDYARSDERAYPVFVAPYVAPAAAAICDQYQVGYLDLAGNCRFVFDQVYIRREGFPNPAVQKRGLRSLYSPKAERVLRVLLAAGKRSWRMQELASESKVSLGQVANVKKLLADREWIETEVDGLRLRSFDEAVLPMLKEWAANFRTGRGTAGEYYSLDPIPQTEAELVSTSRQLNVQLAFSGSSGAARFAPAVRYQRVTAYVLGDVSALVGRLRLKRVSSGANVTLIEPYDEGVLYGATEVERAPVVSPVQLYLDLAQTRGGSGVGDPGGDHQTRMAVTFRDYSADQVEAAWSVLLELVHLLAEYRDDIVVVGGWVPKLSPPVQLPQHGRRGRRRRSGEPRDHQITKSLGCVGFGCS